MSIPIYTLLIIPISLGLLLALIGAVGALLTVTQDWNTGSRYNSPFVHTVVIIAKEIIIIVECEVL